MEAVTSTILDSATTCSRTNLEPFRWDIKLSWLAIIFLATITPPNGSSNCPVLGISTIKRAITGAVDSKKKIGYLGGE